MSEEIECTTKKWGSSIGVIIPSEVVRKERLRPNETIRIVIKKIPLAKTIWGAGSVKDMRPTDEILKELRNGW